MNECEIIEEKENFEEDTYKSMRELSKYSKIVSKQGNLSILFKNYHQIKLKDSNSLSKISLLIGNLPEENVCFTFYVNEEEEQSEEGAKQSKKALRRYSKREIMNSMKKKKTKIDDEDNATKNSDYVNLVDKIKPIYAQEIYKNGNIIGYNHDLFKKVWKNLYVVTLLISIISLIGLGIYSVIILKEKRFKIIGADILSLISLILMVISSISGNKKITSKKKVNFTMENWLLLTFIFISISCLVYWSLLYKDKSIGLYLYVYVFVDIIFGFLLLMSFILIYLNNKMVDFYRQYHKMAEEGTLLTEVK